MIAKGRVENGVVVFEEGTGLPEGTVVSVVPEPSPQIESGGQDSISPEEHRRIGETMDRIAGLPIEGADEPFSGADHKVLYGKP